MLKCSVPDCPKPPRTRGWCSAHYERWRIHGSPLGSTPRETPAQTFLAKAIAYRGSDCLVWPFVHNGMGYGQVCVGGKMRYVHRLVCEATHGRPSQGMEAAHSCGNGAGGCVSPAHIRWADRKTNMREMVDHKHSTRGQKNAAAKLTQASVDKIRALGKSVPQKIIMERYGISRGQVYRIRAGVSWPTS